MRCDYMNKTKKIFLTLLATFFVSFMPVTNAYHNEILSIDGSINEVNDKEITVEGKGVYPEIRLNLTPDTYIYDSKQNFLLEGYEFNKNEDVVAYHGATMSKSLPPLTNSFAVVLKNTAKIPEYIKGTVMERTEDYVKFLSANKDIIFTIHKSVYRDLNKITDNSELLVWYDVVALSMPGQTNPNKLIIVNEKPDIIYTKQAGVFAINNKELQVAPQGNKLLVPVRVIAENLGYNVKWDGDNNCVILTGSETFKIKIDTNTYYNNEEVPLSGTVVLKDGKTYVPLTFFSTVMNKVVKINNNNI